MHLRPLALPARTLLFSALLLFFPAAAPAAAPVPAPVSAAPAEATLSGELTLGVMVIESANNLNPKGSSATLDSLDEAAGTESSVLPMVLPEVAYSTGGSEPIRWYLNSRPPIEEAGRYALVSGVVLPRPGLATVDLALFAVPFAEVWENPYLLGAPRRETDRWLWGGAVALKELFDSPFSLTLAWAADEVDRDGIGRLYPELDRQGKVYSLSLGYRIASGPRLAITPRLHVSRGDYQGEANSSWRVRGELTGRYLLSAAVLLPTLSYSYSRYDGDHPLFADERREHGYGANLVVSYPRLCAVDQLALRAIVGYRLGVGNIDFFETESLLAGVGLAWSF